MIVLEEHPGMELVQCIESNGTVWSTKGRNIQRREQGRQWQSYASFPWTAPRDFFSINRIGRRVARADMSSVFVTSCSHVLGIRAGVVFRVERNQLHALGEISGDIPLAGGFCEDTDCQIYFGEYFLNPMRNPVRVWRIRPDLRGLEVAWEFPEKSVRHVHSVCLDPYDSGVIWVATGDDTNECYLWRTNDQFQTLERFGDGTQAWRAVTIYFTEEYVSWITDSHLAPNYAMRFARGTGEVETGQPFPASVWFGTKTMDGIFVAMTTVEKGPGILRSQASIYVSRDAFHWQEIQAFDKDGWRPYSLFKAGVIYCPVGSMTSERFWLSGQGLVGFDGCTRLVDLEVAAVS